MLAAPPSTPWTGATKGVAVVGSTRNKTNTIPRLCQLWWEWLKWIIGNCGAFADPISRDVRGRITYPLSIFREITNNSHHHLSCYLSISGEDSRSLLVVLLQSLNHYMKRRSISNLLSPFACPMESSHVSPPILVEYCLFHLFHYLFSSRPIIYTAMFRLWLSQLSPWDYLNLFTLRLTSLLLYRLFTFAACRLSRAFVPFLVLLLVCCCPHTSTWEWRARRRSYLPVSSPSVCQVRSTTANSNYPLLLVANRLFLCRLAIPTTTGDNG